MTLRHASLLLVALLLSGCATTPASTAKEVTLPAFILVVGTSMLPTLKPNTRHLELFRPYSELHKGQIVNYLSPFWHKATCHRIVAGWPGKWVMQGDANATVDRGYCTAKNYLGWVIP